VQFQKRKTSVRKKSVNPSNTVWKGGELSKVPSTNLWNYRGNPSYYLCMLIKK
jgi:hypothetical protein